MSQKRCCNCGVKLDSVHAGLTGEGEWLCLRCLCEYLGVIISFKGRTCLFC